MEFPSFILLIVYALALLSFLFLSSLDLYHMVRFGVQSLTSRGMMFLYIVVSVAIIAVTILFLIEYDWSQSFALFDLFVTSQ